MADDTNTAGLKALQEYLKDCDAHAIVPDVGGAWHAAFQAGRASLAASAGSEPVAWMVPHLRTFKGATKVHFTRAPGCTMTDAELMEDLEGRVMWLPSTFSDSPGVTDKFGAHHKPKPLYTHHSPPEGMAGWKLVPVEPTEEMKTAAVKYANGTAVYKNVKAEVLRIEEGIYGEVYEAMIAAAPPLPASEAKELR